MGQIGTSACRSRQASEAAAQYCAGFGEPPVIQKSEWIHSKNEGLSAVSIGTGEQLLVVILRDLFAIGPSCPNAVRSR